MITADWMIQHSVVFWHLLSFFLPFATLLLFAASLREIYRCLDGLAGSRTTLDVVLSEGSFWMVLLGFCDKGRALDWSKLSLHRFSRFWSCLLRVSGWLQPRTMVCDLDLNLTSTIWISYIWGQCGLYKWKELYKTQADLNNASLRNGLVRPVHRTSRDHEFVTTRAEIVSSSSSFLAQFWVVL